jgi:copper chaperone CopZ
MNEVIQTWWPIVASVLAVCSAIISLWVNSQIDKKIAALGVDKKIAEAKADMEASTAALNVDAKITNATAVVNSLIGLHGDRITTLEANWKTLPDREDFHRIALQVERMGGELTSVKTRLDGFEETMRARLDGIAETMKLNGRAIDRVLDYQLGDKT